MSLDVLLVVATEEQVREICEGWVLPGPLEPAKELEVPNPFTGAPMVVTRAERPTFPSDRFVAEAAAPFDEVLEALRGGVAHAGYVTITSSLREVIGPEFLVARDEVHGVVGIHRVSDADADLLIGGLEDRSGTASRESVATTRRRTKHGWSVFVLPLEGGSVVAAPEPPPEPPRESVPESALAIPADIDAWLWRSSPSGRLVAFSCHRSETVRLTPAWAGLEKGCLLYDRQSGVTRWLEVSELWCPSDDRVFAVRRSASAPDGEFGCVEDTGFRPLLLPGSGERFPDAGSCRGYGPTFIAPWIGGEMARVAVYANDDLRLVFEADKDFILSLGMGDPLHEPTMRGDLEGRVMIRRRDRLELYPTIDAVDGGEPTRVWPLEDAHRAHWSVSSSGGRFALVLGSAGAPDRVVVGRFDSDEREELPAPPNYPAAPIITAEELLVQCERTWQRWRGDDWQELRAKRRSIVTMVAGTDGDFIAQDQKHRLYRVWFDGDDVHCEELPCRSTAPLVSLPHDG